MTDNIPSNVGTYLGRRLAQIGIREYFAVSFRPDHAPGGFVVGSSVRGIS